MGEAIKAGVAPRGILICGSGVGVCVAANKIPGIRAGICHDTYSAHQGVEHDDMNVLVLGARIIGSALAFELAHDVHRGEVSGARKDDSSGGSRKCWRSRPSISVSRQTPGAIAFHREPIDCQCTNPAFADRTAIADPRSTRSLCETALRAGFRFRVRSRTQPNSIQILDSSFRNIPKLSLARTRNARERDADVPLRRDSV